VDNAPLAAADGESPVFRDAGVSYLRIPAADPRATAAFYRDVFGWTVDTDRPDPSFEDGTGHVIGHFVGDQPIGGEAGIRPLFHPPFIARRFPVRAVSGERSGV